MKNYISLIIVLIVITCYGCGDDTVGVSNGNSIDNLKIVLLDGFVAAERLSPDPNDPGSYNFYSAFTAELINTGTTDTIFGVGIVSEKIYSTSSNEYIQTILLKEMTPITLPPGQRDTVEVENVLGNDKILNPPCDQAVHFQLRAADEEGRYTYHWTEEYILTCLPPPWTEEKLQSGMSISFPPGYEGDGFWCWVDACYFEKFRTDGTVKFNFAIGEMTGNRPAEFEELPPQFRYLHRELITTNDGLKGALYYTEAFEHECEESVGTFLIEKHETKGYHEVVWVKYDYSLRSHVCEVLRSIKYVSYLTSIIQAQNPETKCIALSYGAVPQRILMLKAM